jgi:hypothetical protein
MQKVSLIFKFKCEGAFFIDRDGTYFRYILNYLRDGEVDLMEDEVGMKQLLREAQYYRVEGLIKHLEEKLHYAKRKSDTKGQYAVCYLGGYGKSAQIYTKGNHGDCIDR